MTKKRTLLDQEQRKETENETDIMCKTENGRLTSDISTDIDETLVIDHIRRSGASV